MTELDRQTLLDQANELALDFPSNIPTKKLAAMVAEAQGPAVKEEEPEEEVEATQESAPTVAEVTTEAERKLTPMQERAVAKRKQIRAMREKATKKHIVTLTNKDKRENEVVTTAFLSVENEHFSVARIVPLDIPVELEQCLIRLAETTMMTLHKDEIKNGQRTGNKVAVPTKKYIVSYSNKEPD